MRGAVDCDLPIVLVALPVQFERQLSDLFVRQLGIPGINFVVANAAIMVPTGLLGPDRSNVFT